MRVRMVRMRVIVLMRMIVLVNVTVLGLPRQSMLTTKRFVATGTITVAFARTVRWRAAYSFDMVMMARLFRPYLHFKTEHLRAILAHLAVHHCPPFKGLNDTINERVHNQRVMAQILGVNKLDVRVPGCHFVSL